MRVMVVGSGGREHALCWSLGRSPRLSHLFCAPGNPGIAEIAEIVPVAADDVAAIARACREYRIDLVVPGPEQALVNGLSDQLLEFGIPCAGPSRAAARLEGSKIFAKEICSAAGVRTPAWEAFSSAQEALTFIARRGTPIVIKKDGLAAGKGVVIAHSRAEAETCIESFLSRPVGGGEPDPILVEELIVGEELSFFALCDGERAVSIGAARDFKRLGVGDTGPNTGGMGAYAHPAGMDPRRERQILDSVVGPVLVEMAKRGSPFKGILFAGLMIEADHVSVLEFNVRFGDPEAQALFPLMESDLLSALATVVDGTVESAPIAWLPDHAVSVVVASRGYPAAPETGSAIHDLAEAIEGERALIFQGATRRDPAGGLRADGGRVLTITGLGSDRALARSTAYAVTGRVKWPEGIFRSDIGA